jgi:hypothetical protein
MNNRVVNKNEYVDKPEIEPIPPLRHTKDGIRFQLWKAVIILLEIAYLLQYSF